MYFSQSCHNLHENHTEYVLDGIEKKAFSLNLDNIIDCHIMNGVLMQ